MMRSRHRQRQRRLTGLTLALLLLAGAVGAWAVWRWQGWVETDDAFIAGHILPVKAQTDGLVVEVLTEDTRYVKQGDILVKLDDKPTAIALQQAEAELAQSVRTVLAMQARVETLKQRVASREAALRAVSHDWQRYEAAAHDGAASAQQVDNAEDKRQELTAGLREAQAELNGASAQLGKQAIAEHPVVQAAKAKFRLAFLAHVRRHIIAPVAGVVAKRKVQVGDMLKTGTPLLNIVPLDDIWVEAHFLETQLADIRPGQYAEIRVDAYGEQQIYQGIVQGLNPATGSRFALLPTDNATGNFIHVPERLQVRIGLDPAAVAAKPLQLGLSTLTRIRIAQPAPLSAATIRLQHPAYHTEVYRHELEDAETRIEQILQQNGG